MKRTLLVVGIVLSFFASIAAQAQVSVQWGQILHPQKHTVLQPGQEIILEGHTISCGSVPKPSKVESPTDRCDDFSSDHSCQKGLPGDRCSTDESVGTCVRESIWAGRLVCRCK